MIVKFKTNLDRYDNSHFPRFEIPPRIGETVLVSGAAYNYYKNEKLPTRLEVVDVVWGEDSVTCELWYKQIDVDIANRNGVNLF